MPWCDSCDHFLNPNTVREDGTCPDCGNRVTTPAKLKRSRKGKGASADALAVTPPSRESKDASGTGDDEQLPTPWHFKVLVVALVIYLGWRLIQGILWVSHKL